MELEEGKKAVESRITDLVGGLLASPPIIYYKLHQALRDPDTSFEDFARIISVDPGLAARLMQLVNSPFYGLSTRVDNLSQAISIVGVEQLMELALATEIVGKFKGIPKELADMEAFWVHSVACGLGARTIAADRGASHLESYYLAGMLHDIGSLIIFKEIPQEARQVISRCLATGAHLSEKETEILGFNHNDVGRVLLEKWKLPERLVEAVYFHHHPLEARKYPLETAIIHVADILAYDMRLGYSGEPFVPPLSPKILELLGLMENSVKEIRRTVQKQVNELEGIFY